MHRDLKLENILMGRDQKSFQVYLIDFGLAKRYIDTHTEKHIPMKAGKAIMGALEYSSINNHAGKELSRRDDLEALGYILAHLVLGDLPWSALAAQDKYQENEQSILQLKSSFEQSAAFSQLPDEIQAFIKEVKRLEFTEDPKYLKYRRSFKMLMVKKGLEFDRIYDWVLLPVRQQVDKQITAIDQLLDMEDELTAEEQAEINYLIQKYQEDPTELDFGLEEIRRQNRKFDVISPNGSQSGSETEEPASKKKADVIVSGNKGKLKGKNKDCKLI